MGELQIAMAKLGDNATEEEIKEIMQEVDLNQDGAVDFEEFVKAMMSS